MNIILLEEQMNRVINNKNKGYIEAQARIMIKLVWYAKESARCTDTNTAKDLEQTSKIVEAPHQNIMLNSNIIVLEE